ncbi:hypothetical protein NONO_c41880 [Nocardia nova SH22a]|uniref:Uncharacterized protein n=1 Tax=Nocardia nova SH22a TaxID=1415166 RepID=W5TIA6_9NOCA|nr:hypothetical protein [Nocardia nova]AHH18972.1 hypothetical protein NONO_c41880 [Nocardia nova SH22a]
MHGTRSAVANHRRGRGPRRRSLVVLALVGVCLLAPAATGTSVADPVDTGFAQPFAGAPGYQSAAPTRVSGPDELNQPLGEELAERIAGQIGLGPADALSDQQYQDLSTGGGVSGDRNAADVIDACVRILTNTVGRPLYSDVNGENTPSVLAGYGLYVNPGGQLESPANADAPTRQVNLLIAPGGYVGNWLRDNGAARTLAALYRSAYTVQAAYGFAAQQISGAAQLVTNTGGGVNSVVGMSMAPPLWIVNFALIYILKPSLAAQMPAHWAPIPAPVVDAIKASPTGQVPFADYASYLR